MCEKFINVVSYSIPKWAVLMFEGANIFTSHNSYSSRSPANAIVYLIYYDLLRFSVLLLMTKYILQHTTRKVLQACPCIVVGSVEGDGEHPRTIIFHSALLLPFFFTASFSELNHLVFSVAALSLYLYILHSILV